MRRLRHPALRLTGGLALALLVLVGLAQRSHRHADHTARPCAACVVAQQATTPHVPVVAGIEPEVVGVLNPGLAEAVPARVDRPVHAGRAPPPFLPTPA
ncbi:MAG TPA: hypothetical protein VKA21_15495 [Candidatus Binatia bacterium]|nr:hypothetical protein [Candidatus Binatia bacterium]